MLEEPQPRSTQPSGPLRRPPGERCLVMFDWDGVLADSLVIFSSIFLGACRRCGFHGLKSTGDFIALFDDNLYEALAALALDRETVDRILQICKHDTLARLGDIQLFDGIPTALERIAAHHVVSIVTSNLNAIPAGVLEREGVACVAEVLGVETGTSKVEKMHRSMSRHPGLRAYYVGDTKGDMMEGRTAGAVTVAVTWGWHHERRLQAARPDFLVRSPAELASLFSLKGK